jgi:hypothetical protein
MKDVAKKASKNTPLNLPAKPTRVYAKAAKLTLI